MYAYLKAYNELAVHVYVESGVRELPGKVRHKVVSARRDGKRSGNTLGS